MDSVSVLVGVLTLVLGAYLCLKLCRRERIRHAVERPLDHTVLLMPCPSRNLDHHLCAHAGTVNSLTARPYAAMRSLRRRSSRIATRASFSPKLIVCASPCATLEGRSPRKSDTNHSPFGCTCARYSLGPVLAIAYARIAY